MKSKKKLIAIAGILGVAVVGGTFAYFTQTDALTNRFHTGTYETKLVEDFKPKDGENWEPGTTVNKDVHIENDGTVPVVVRVSFAEKWVRKGDGDTDAAADPFYSVDTTDKEMPVAPSFVLIGYGDDEPAAQARMRNKFENIYQSSPVDGEASAEVDDSVVLKALHVGMNAADEEDDGYWIYNPQDGYYYFTRVLEGKASETSDPDKTTRLLDSVKLIDNVDMGKFEEKKYYTTEGNPEAPDTDPVNAEIKDWYEFATMSDASRPEGYRYATTHEMAELLKESKSEPITFMKSETQIVPGLEGYSNADYTLTITAQTVQATDKAVEEIFGVKLEDMKELGCNWALDKEGDLHSGDEAIEPAETSAEETTAAAPAETPEEEETSSGAEESSPQAQTPQDPTAPTGVQVVPVPSQPEETESGSVNP